MFTHTFTKNWSNGGAPINKSIDVVAGSEINIDESVAGAATDLAINCAIDISALKSLFMVCDRDLQIQTNDGTSPDDTILLKADQPLIWNAADGYFPNPLTADTTILYATLAAGAAATLKVRALVDPTP